MYIVLNNNREDGRRISNGKPALGLEEKRLRMLSSLREKSGQSVIKKSKKQSHTKRFSNVLSRYKKHFQHSSWSNYIRPKVLRQTQETPFTVRRSSSKPCDIPQYGEIIHFKDLKMTIDMKEEIIEEQKAVNDILFFELKKEISILKKETIDKRKELSNIKGAINQHAKIPSASRPDTTATQVSNKNIRKDYKWLIPKTYAKVAGKNARNFEVTLKNRFSDLEVEAIPSGENNLYQQYSTRIPHLHQPQLASMQAESYKKKNSLFPNQHPENQGNQRKRQFHNNVEATHKIAICSDSMAKRLNMNVFNKKLKHGEATLNAIPGARAEKLNYCATFTLKDECPEVAIIHVGINDLLSRRKKCK